MTASIIHEVEQSQLKTDLPQITAGDTVDVHVRIIEGVKERIQVFNGVIIKMQGRGLSRTMTVRRIVTRELRDAQRRLGPEMSLQGSSRIELKLSNHGSG